MVRYDENIIQQHAAALYRQAERIARGMAARGALYGLAAGAVIGYVLRDQAAHELLALAAVALAALGAYQGWQIGTARGFTLRLEAQTALCQAAIERNTRADQAAASGAKAAA